MLAPTMPNRPGLALDQTITGTSTARAAETAVLEYVHVATWRTSTSTCSPRMCSPCAVISAWVRATASPATTS